MAPKKAVLVMMQDYIFGNVTHPEWSKAIGSRVEASSSLHNLLLAHGLCHTPVCSRSYF